MDNRVDGDSGVDADVAAFGEFMEGLADAIRVSGEDIRAGLEAVAEALRGPVRLTKFSVDWEEDS